MARKIYYQLRNGLCFAGVCCILASCVGSGAASTTNAGNSSATATVVSNSLAVFNSLHPLNVDYERSPSVADINAIGDYVLSSTGKPFFNVVILFAANINGTIGTPVLTYNPSFQTLLQTESGLVAIHNLQSKGVLVLVTYLGNHDDAGWSCFRSTAIESGLASQMVSEVNKYGLDGIDIDDEYSNCDNSGTQLAPSIYNLAQAIKTNPSYNGKILTKALWDDSAFFSGNTNLANYLDGGWQMSYGNQAESTVINSLSTYSIAGMNKSHLAIGVDPESAESSIYTTASYAVSMTNTALANGFGGIMVFGTNKFSDLATAIDYLSGIAKIEFNSSVIYIGPTPMPQPTPSTVPTPSPKPSPVPMPTNIPESAPQGSYIRGASAINWDGTHLSAVYNGIATPVLNYRDTCATGSAVAVANGILSCFVQDQGVVSILDDESFSQGYWLNSCSVVDVSIDTTIDGCSGATPQTASGYCFNQIQAYCQNDVGNYVATSFNPNANGCYDATKKMWNIALDSNGQLYCPAS